MQDLITWSSYNWRCSILGGSKYGITGGTQGRFGPPVDISGSLARINQTGEAAGNAPLETISRTSSR
jgi:hypothetical protein